MREITATLVLPKQYDQRTNWISYKLEDKVFFVGSHPEEPPIVIDCEARAYEIVELDFDL